MQALTKTRQRGLFITKLNCASQTQKLNNGAYFAPAMMVFNIIKAFLENQTILLPLNRTFYPQDNFNCEGAAQLLCKIQNGNIYPVFLQNTPEDIKNMQDSLAEYEIGKKALAEYIK